LKDHNNGLAPISKEIATYYRALYDAEIRCLDARLRDFFASLEDSGVLAHATVVITADHGEEFLEHGMLVHHQIYHENVHVPLIFVFPGGRPTGRVSRLVESIDIAPTLYDLAGLSQTMDLPGRSVVPALVDPEGADGEIAFVQSIDGHRGVYSQNSDSVVHLLSLYPKRKSPRRPFSVASFLILKVPSAPLRFEARGFTKPTRLDITVGDVLRTSFELQPGSWMPLEVDLPQQPGSQTLTLSSEDCFIIPESLERGTPRCRSFLVRNLPIRHVEMYRVDRDRAEIEDLTHLEPELAADLETVLESTNWEPISPVGTNQLDTELEQRLRSLGYLD
jgi:hypothetical protein